MNGLVLTLFVVLELYGSTLAYSSRQHHCLRQNESYTDLEWDWQPASLSIECDGRYKELHCCAQHYTSIAWYERQSKTHPWVSFHTKKGVRYIDSNEHYINETAIFVSVSTLDNHEYKCIVTNEASGKSLEQIVELQVLHNCGSFTQGPIMLDPEVPNKGERPSVTIQKHTQIGSSLNLSCLAFLGDSPDGAFIGWQRFLENPTNLVVFHDDPAARIYYEKSSRVHGTGEEVILHIRNITMKDFGNYSCVAYNGYPTSPRVYFIVKNESPKHLWKRAMTVSGPIIAIVLIVGVIVLGAVIAKRRHIGIAYKRRFKNMYTPPDAPKCISLFETNHEDSSGPNVIIKDYMGTTLQPESAWQIENSTLNPWVQAEFDEPKTICAIRIMATAENDMISEFRLWFSGDGEEWWEFPGTHCPGDESEKVGRVFSGDSGDTEAVKHLLPQNIVAKYVRLHPLNGGVLKWDILGWTDCITLMYPDSSGIPIEDKFSGELLHKKLKSKHALLSSRDVKDGEKRTIIGTIGQKSHCVLVMLSSDLIDGIFSKLPTDDVEAQRSDQSHTNRQHERQGRPRNRESATPLLRGTSEEPSSPKTDVPGTPTQPMDDVNACANVNEADDVFPDASSLDSIQCKIYLNLVLSICQEHLCKVIFLIRPNMASFDWNHWKRRCKGDDASDEVRTIIDDLELCIKTCKALDWSGEESIEELQETMSLSETMNVVNLRGADVSNDMIMHM